MNRRQLLIAGSLAALSSGSAPDAAVHIAHEISKARSNLLTEVQTSHATDRAIASLVARDTPSMAALANWSRSGTAVLRVNAAGILAKIGSPLVDSEAVAVLRRDGDVRERYLTAVLSRILTLPWDAAYNLATTRGGLAGTGQLATVIAELRNPYDAGARWCSTVMLYRSRADDPVAVSSALVEALKTEPARENLRALGSALAGIDPVTI